MAARQKPYGGVYENMDFETIYGPKEWHEFPKAIPTGPDGQSTIVQNAAEEKAIRARMQKDEDDAPALQPAYVADPEKEILISRARELNVPFNPKWSKAKLTATVEAAESDVDNLPAEAKATPQHKSLAEIAESLPPLHNESIEDQKERLLDQAKAMGIKGNAMHMWGIPRLKAAMAEHEAKA
jgi:hypothetical protein